MVIRELRPGQELNLFFPKEETVFEIATWR
jgi:hypothetical protein